MRRKPQRGALLVGVVLMGTITVICPWAIRNRIVMGDWIFTRTSFGLNLWIANSGVGQTMISPAEYALDRPEEQALLRTLGEAGYDRVAVARASEWIMSHPALFMGLGFRRTGVFWTKEVLYGASPWISRFFIGLPLVCGAIGLLAAARHRQNIWPCVVPLAVYPLMYALTHAEARYRFPIDAFLLIPAAYLVSVCWRRWRTRCPQAAR